MPRPRNSHSATMSCRLSSPIMSATPNAYWRTCSMRCNHTRIRLAVMHRILLSSLCLEQTLTSSQSTAWVLQEVRRSERVLVRVAELAPQRVQPEQARWQLVQRVRFLLLPYVCCCWCCGRTVCVCVLVAVDWSVCRAWCAAYGACLAAALSLCGVLSVCVCLPHLSSPLLLSMSLTVQISSTPLNDHTHDDDVPSAVRPVGARPVLLPVRVHDSD
ncbi:hypothetical protein ECC02_011131 [Trypanosoma cruzi]|uniref:Mucin TcMUCII n=1 Tax=Trypanosoma cruzi TaxID=5693 RepID=A0A7J6XPF4_TRYCR|nr:hypothetical protein ECC02_011131 [Trypanosoma cruzi]